MVYGEDHQQISITLVLKVFRAPKVLVVFKVHRVTMECKALLVTQAFLDFLAFKVEWVLRHRDHRVLKVKKAKLDFKDFKEVKVQQEQQVFRVWEHKVHKVNQEHQDFKDLRAYKDHKVNQDLNQ